MPEQLRVEAVKCAEKLKPLGRTLTDATEHFLAHLAAIQRSCTVGALIAEFRSSKEQDGASERYQKDMKNRLQRFEDDLGPKMVAEIRSSSIDDWLRRRKVGAQTRNNFRTILRTLFEFGVMRGYLLENPVAKTAKAKVVQGSPEIFTPEEMQRLLECSSPAFIPYLAIGAFAGLRAAEIERLDWSEIDLGQKLIHVKAEKSKTAQRRLTTISECLAAWLAPFSQSSGPVARNVRMERGRCCATAGIEWKSNVLRHSFASYHLANFKNSAETASELGHSSPVMLFKHYRELVTPDASTAWWNINPPSQEAKVVVFDGNVQNV